MPDGPTFSSIICRLEALLARVNAEPGLGAFQAKLAHTLAKGDDRAVEGRDLCAASNAKKATARLKQVERAVIQYAHRLSGLPARKKLDETLRQAFLAPAERLRADTRTLRKDLHCPGEASSPL